MNATLVKTPPKKKRKASVKKTAKPRVRKKTLAVNAEGIIVEHPFKKAPSYFWVRPDARVVLAGVAAGWILISAGVVSVRLAGIVEQEHGPMVTLQTEYEPAQPPVNVLTDAAGVATGDLAIPPYSNTFSPIVPFGPVLATPALVPDDIHVATNLVLSSWNETIASAWGNSFGLVARAFVQSTYDLAAVSSAVISNEFNLKALWQVPPGGI